MLISSSLELASKASSEDLRRLVVIVEVATVLLFAQVNSSSVLLALFRVLVELDLLANDVVNVVIVSWHVNTKAIPMSHHHTAVSLCYIEAFCLMLLLRLIGSPTEPRQIRILKGILIQIRLLLARALLMNELLLLL